VQTHPRPGRHQSGMLVRQTHMAAKIFRLDQPSIADPEVVTVAARPTPGTLTDIRTDLASHDLHHIWVRGHDLSAELMGRRSFAEAVMLLIGARFPEERECRVVDAVLVSLMEHGLTPSSVTARVTYSVSPESIQGAVAAGLIGVGSQVLGSMEECGRLLTRIAEECEAGTTASNATEGIVAEYRAARRHLPGLGHAIHTEGDPRASRLLDIAAENGVAGAHVDALHALAQAAARRRPLPVNVTGAVAAVLLELGIPWQLHRGFSLISRTAGLVAHIGEEINQPITPALRALMRSASTDDSDDIGAPE
jgi:citrate synthase